MDLTYKREVTVGALVLVGFVVFTGFMFWLTGRSIVSKAIAVPVVFKNVSGLKEGDPVRVSGVKKGRVGQVRLRRVGQVVVTLQLDPEVRPHKDARATVASADFLGAKYVDYDYGVSDTMLADGQSIQGVTEEQFADVAQGAAKSAQELIANVNKGLNPGQLANDIHNTLIATQPLELETGLEKQITVKLAAKGTEVEVTHRLRNTKKTASEFAPWALTMMAQGGTGITGFPPRGTHPEVLAPTNPLVLWAFSDLSDPRWRFTKK